MFFEENIEFTLFYCNRSVMDMLYVIAILKIGPICYISMRPPKYSRISIRPKSDTLDCHAKAQFTFGVSQG